MYIIIRFVSLSHAAAMKRLLLVLLSALPLTSPSLANTPTEETTTSTDSCTVQAWVRAEDLSPDHISHSASFIIRCKCANETSVGELRVKVKEPRCANQVTSVALRLQLLEFGEVKYLYVRLILLAASK
jgi:hypothetical protein